VRRLTGVPWPDLARAGTTVGANPDKED